MPRYTITLGFALTALFAITAPADGQAPVGSATGRIEGKVTLLPTLSTRKPAVRLYADYGASPATVRDSAPISEMRNVVIYIDSVGLTRPPVSGASNRFAINQVNATFAPHVLAVLQGSTVGFLNGDARFHNVFSLSKAASFDLGRYPRGVSRTVRFDKAGIVQVFCHIHSDMSAIVQVVPNAFFATPNDAGHFSLDGVPAGVYRIVGWHERVGRVAQQVRVVPNQTSVIDLSLPIVDERQTRR